MCSKNYLVPPHLMQCITYIFSEAVFFCLLLLNDTRLRTSVENINVPPTSLDNVLCNGTDETVF